MDTAQNLTEYLFRRSQQAAPGNHTAIVFGEQTITYDEIYRLTAKCSGLLRSLDVAQGDRVAILMRDCPAFFFAFLGATRIGAIAVPVNTALPPMQLQYILENSAAKVALITDDQLAKLKAISHNLPALGKTLVVGRGDLSTLDFQAELQAAREAPAGETKADDPAFILYTSGSTGVPKGAVHLHRNLPYTVETFIEQVVGVKSNDRIFSSSRLFFAYGLGNSLSSPLGFGASVALTGEKPTPDIIADVLSRFHPTLFFGVPAVFRALLQYRAEGHKLEFESVKVCFSAGEKLPAPLYHEWKKTLGLDIVDSLGTTEALHVFMCNRRDNIRPGSSGIPVPGYEVKLVDDGGREVEGEGVGNLMIRGGSVMGGYWNKPEKTAEALQDGWLRTGDVYRRDADGFYWNEGRSDDIFKVKGLWVSPAVVEEAVLSHPDVLEAAVIPGVDRDNLATVIAYVVSRTSEAPQEFTDRVRAHARQLLPDYQRPTEVRLIDQLPRTATGKVQRFKLREMYATSRDD